MLRHLDAFLRSHSDVTLMLQCNLVAKLPANWFHTAEQVTATTIGGLATYDLATWRHATWRDATWRDATWRLGCSAR